jgi:hypothetical protein
MTDVTFSLIRKHNPEISNAEDIGEVDVIRLLNCNIVEIENLELFHHVSELYLNQNKIETLKGLSIFYQLKVVDVSYNKISSDALLESVPFLPKSLLSINLTGNPCVEDEMVLGTLQDALPEVIIAIEIDEQEDLQVNSTEEGKDEKSEGQSDPEVGIDLPVKPSFLDTEEVLKSIVERKCKMQNTSSTFDLEREVKVSFFHRFTSSRNTETSTGSQSGDGQIN